MEIWGLLVLLALGRFGAGVFARHRKGEADRIDAAWRRLAEQLDIPDEERAASSSRHLAGMYRGSLVYVKEEPGSRWSDARLLAAVMGSWDRGIRITAGSPQSLQVGDAAFDKAIGVEGPEALALAALDHPTRALLLSLLEEGVALVDCQLRYSAAGRLGASPGIDADALRHRLDRMVEAAKSIENRTLHPADSLAQNVAIDPCPAVRCRSLEALAEHFAGEPQFQSAVTAAMGDPSLEVRVWAAWLLGDAQGAALLDTVARSSSTPPAWRVEALRRLATFATPGELIASARVAALSEVVPLQQTAIEVLGRAQDVEWLDNLCELAGDTRLSVACVRALRRLGDPRAEPALVKLLSHDDGRIRLAAVKALAEVGTSSAVAPLLALAKGFFGNDPFKQAARSAARTIQARLGHVDAGRLSIAEHTEHQGAMSLSVAGGELSLADDED